MSKLFFSFIVRGVSSLMAFLFSVFVARTLPQEDVGSFFTGITVMVGLAVVIRMGFDNYIIKRNSLGGTDGVSNLFSFTLISFQIYIALLIIIILCDSLVNIMHVEQHMYYFVISSMFFSMLWLASGFFKSIAKAPVSNFIEVGLMPTVLLLAYMSIHDSVTLLVASKIYLATSISMSAVVYAIIYRQFASSVELTWSILLSEFRESSGIMLANLMDYFVMWFSAIILTFHVDMAEVAKFQVALRLSILISLLSIVLNSVSAPILARLFNDNDLVKVSEVLRLSSSLMLLLAITPLVLYCFYPKILLSLFGIQYQTASIALIILSVGQLVNVVSGSVGYVLMMSGYSHVYKVVTFYSAFVTVALALILVPTLGIIGSAFATSIGVMLKNLLGVYQVYKIHNVISLPSTRNIINIVTLKEKYEIFTCRY